MDLEHTKYKLSNGLDVILREDHRLPLVAVNLWYHVGPANERPGLTGFAHLFEHMMFQGSKYAGDDAHFRMLEAAGASDINGTTDFDRTNYFETLPSDQLELALWLESDRMGFLLDKLDHGKLENQRDVVRNERRQSVESAPYGLVEEEMFHQLFPSEHPYYASVIGSHADIEAARLRDIRDFFRLFYAPNNASLAIVGDINRTVTEKWIERYFGSIPAGPPVPEIEVAAPVIRSEKRVVVTDQIELPRIYLAWITPPIFRAGDAECDLLAKILGGGKSSRLYKNLVYEKQIAQDVVAHQYSLVLGSIFFIQATAKPGVEPQRLEAAIDAELHQVRQQGPTALELEGAQNIFESEMIRGLETLGGFGGVADRFNTYNHYLGDPDYLSQDLARYRNATTDSLRAVAETNLTNQSRVVVVGVSGAKKIHDIPRSEDREIESIDGEPDSPAQDWRKNSPSRGRASSMNLPIPKVFELDNGLDIYFIEQHDLPLVAANLIVLCGSDANPLDSPGLASFTADMLDEGTTKRSALTIADDLDRLGAALSTGSTTDLSYFTVRTLKRNVGPAFELMADVLLNPSFPEKEIDRRRHHRLTRIQQQRDSPHALGSRALLDVLYGSRHPYGYTELGTKESNSSIQRDQLAAFWKSGYVPTRAALVVAGDLDESELLRLAQDYLGVWEGTAEPSGAPEAPPPSQRRIVIVDKPELPQTTLLVGHVGVARSNPDYIPIDVMNTQLGGLFSSRINLNLRERNGYTYGASSSFSSRRGPGPFLVATSVRQDVTGPAVREIVHEIEGMRASEPAEQELQLAKDSISRSLPGFFETTAQSASTIGGLFVHGLELAYYRDLPGQVDAVTAQQVQRVAEQYLRPDALVVVAVGDRQKIEPQLAELEFGEIEIRSLDPVDP